jgi:hypothetical protein
MDASLVPKEELIHQSAHVNLEATKMPTVNANHVQRNVRHALMPINVLTVQPTELTHHTVSAQLVLTIIITLNVHLVLTNVTHVLIAQITVLSVLKD